MTLLNTDGRLLPPSLHNSLGSQEGSHLHLDNPTSQHPKLSAETILRKYTNNLFVTQRNPTPTNHFFWTTLHNPLILIFQCFYLQYLQVQSICWKLSVDSKSELTSKYYFQILSRLFVILWHDSPCSKIISSLQIINNDVYLHLWYHFT